MAGVNDPERERKRAVYGGGSDFWLCPISGRVIRGNPHDNKVLCGCGRTNPAVLVNTPKADETGGVPGGPAHHFKSFLKPATVDDFIDQQDIDKILRAQMN